MQQTVHAKFHRMNYRLPGQDTEESCDARRGADEEVDAVDAIIHAAARHAAGLDELVVMG